MSAIKLIPASGGGSVSLAPPNSTSGADVTFTLPSTSQSFGKILQVVQTVKTDTASLTAVYSSPADWGLSCSITPASTSSKILVTCNMILGGTSMYGLYTYLVRDSTQLMLGDSAGNRPRVTKNITDYHDGNVEYYKSVDVDISYLDSPSTTSSVTYKVQGAVWGGSETVYLNRNGIDANNSEFDGRSASTITLMEVAA